MQDERDDGKTQPLHAWSNRRGGCRRTWAGVGLDVQRAVGALPLREAALSDRGTNTTGLQRTKHFPLYASHGGDAASSGVLRQTSTGAGSPCTGESPLQMALQPEASKCMACWKHTSIFKGTPSV